MFLQSLQSALIVQNAFNVHTWWPELEMHFGLRSKVAGMKS